VNTPVTCRSCDGRGEKWDASAEFPRKCLACFGSGRQVFTTEEMDRAKAWIEADRAEQRKLVRKQGRAAMDAAVTAITSTQEGD